MIKSEFDRFADAYARHIEDAIPLINCKADAFSLIKASRITDYLQETFPSHEDLHLLDAGCGVGMTDEILKQSYPRITGLDVSDRSLSIASKRNPEINYVSYDGHRFPFKAECFDVVFAICVLHHIAPSQWANFVNEAERVLKPGGVLMIFEHNPLSPLTRWIVARCEFDRDATLMPASVCRRIVQSSSFNKITTSYLLFAPSLNKTWQQFETRVLYRLPVGAQYSVYATKHR